MDDLAPIIRDDPARPLTSFGQKSPQGPSLRDLIGQAVITAAAGLIGAVIAGLLVVLWLRQTEPLFTAEMMIGPTARSGMAGMGIRLPGETNPALEPTAVERLEHEHLSDYEHFRHLLHSITMARALANESGSGAQAQGVMQAVLWSQWDAEEGTWTPPGGLLNDVLAGLRRLAGREAWLPPDETELAAALRRQLQIIQLGDTATYRLRVRHPDRETALMVLGSVYETADRLLRDEARRRLAVHTAHIENRLENVGVTEHRAVLTRMLSRLLEIQLLLEVDLPFAADVIVEPSAPEKPDWPDPIAVIGASVLVGGMSAAMLAMLLLLSRRPDGDAVIGR